MYADPQRNRTARPARARQRSKFQHAGVREASAHANHETVQHSVETARHSPSHAPPALARRGCWRRVNSSASAARALPPVRWVAEAPGAAPAAARVAASAAGESSAGRSASTARSISVGGTQPACRGISTFWPGSCISHTHTC
jgi:hypothetical protein